MIFSNHLSLNDLDNFPQKENRQVVQIPKLYHNYQNPQNFQGVDTDRHEYFQNPDITPKNFQSRPPLPNSKS